MTPPRKKKKLVPASAGNGDCAGEEEGSSFNDDTGKESSAGKQVGFKFFC